MASTLTVEDGSGVAGADSYVTLAECQAYELAVFGANLTYTDAELDGALRRATIYLSNLNWKGAPTNGRSQPLAWPRSGVHDEYGNNISDDEIPQELKDAQCILARSEVQSVGILSPQITPGSQIKRERVGPLETEYQDGASSPSGLRPVVTMAMDRVTGLLRDLGSANVLVRG